ncbi:MAG: 23S rRNA (uracil(1939)-C(5))-methyltransferase RlmD [Halanaerobiaceae bacterium]
MVKKGEYVELVLDDLAYGGDCVGHLESGLAVFVPGTIPGEKVRARITKVKNSYARARCLEILEPVAARIEPHCPEYGSCGGCQLQHMEYEAQLRAKRKFVEDALARIGNLSKVEVCPVVGSDFPWYYRNKAQFPLGKDEDGQIYTGFYARGTHDLVTNEECFIQHQLINRIKREALDLMNEYEFSVYEEEKDRGLLRHLVVRTGVCTNQALVVLVTAETCFAEGEEFAHRLRSRVPELKGVYQNINPAQTNVIMGKEMNLLSGEKKITEYIAQVKYQISPLSFFQVNTLQAGKLYQEISKQAQFTGQEILLDAYCGPGSIGIYLAEEVKEVYGIEENEKAVVDARHNAQINHQKNCTFIQGKVEQELPALLVEQDKPDVVVVDPPRKGLSDTFRDLLLKVQPRKLIYVSCNPSTLARDIKYFSEDYNFGSFQPVDMFPQTYHIETVTCLQRK